MARPRKNGLDYFPFDIDFFSDIKIRKLIRSQGGKAVTVYVLLLCLIYESGYYLRWDKELPFIIWEQTGYDEAYIQEVINSCLTIGLFNSKIFKEYNVLTSKSIQLRFFSVSKRRVQEEDYKYLSGVIVTETGVSVTETRVKATETRVSDAESAQRKEKESKEKKIKKETEQISRNAVELWEKNIGTITANLAEQVSALVKECGFIAYDMAINRAVSHNKRNFPWIKAVAENIAEGDDFGDKQEPATKTTANDGKRQKSNAEYTSELQATARKTGGPVI